MALPLHSLLQASTRRHPERPALAWGTVIWTYRELSEAAGRLAHRLEQEGAAAPGQRVGILAANTPALIAGMFAAWQLGAVAVPLNARWREYELSRVLADAEVETLVAVESYQGYSFAELLPRLRNALPILRRCYFVDPVGEVRGESMGTAGIGSPSRRGGAGAEPLDPETALLLYTSGTTGVPKGALVKHQTLADGAAALAALLEARPEDVGLFMIPVAHAFGLEVLLATLVAGSQAVVVDAAFSLQTLVEAVHTWKVTMLHGSPALFITLLKAKSLPGLVATVRTGLMAGATCPPWALEQLDQVGLPILNLYGMTEIGAASSCRPGDPPAVRYHTVGRPLRGYDMRVMPRDRGSRIEDRGSTPTALQVSIPDPREGEVQVRGPYVTPGYFRQPGETAAAFDGDWFRTGDLGCFDEQGNLLLRGRAKEVIQVGGLNVFPAEVEGFLLTHPDVLQAVVVGTPQPVLGEVPRAFVVPRLGSNLTPAALLRFARQHIANYKLPYGIHLLPELPLLTSGKPDRAALRRSLSEEQVPCNP
jgi:acyl-CoA synthetase (AMP-forming)/AMP-acid ligase II